MCRTIVILTLGFLVSCSSPDVIPSHTFQIYEENGVTIAENEGGPKYRDDLFNYSLLMRLEENEERPDSFHDSPSWFVCSDEDMYFIPHRKDRRIQVFDSEGNYINSFGRIGQGPGEFINLEFQSLLGDTLTFFDNSQRRTTRYITDGTFLEVFNALPSMGRLMALEKNSFGHLIGTRRLSNTMPEQMLESHGVIVMTATGDTVCWHETGWIDVLYRSVATKRIIEFRSYVFGPAPKALFDPKAERFLLTTGIESRIYWFNTDGTPNSIYEIGLPKEQITSEDRRSAESYMVNRIAEAPEQAKEMRRQALQSLKFAPNKAFWRDVQIDDAGYLWLEISRSTSVEEPTFRVISPNGEYLGDSTWPTRRARIMSGKLLALIRDEATGAYIPTIFAITPKVEGLEYQ